MAGAGVFEIICRINHSCRPNSCAFWNEDLKMETVHAIRPIKKGEEVTIVYGGYGPRQERRAWHKATHKFDCTCESCSLPAHERIMSDFARNRIQELDHTIATGLQHKTDMVEVRRACDEKLILLEGEFGSGWPLLADTLEQAYQVAVLEGFAEMAKQRARSAYEIRVVAQGADHPEAKLLLAAMQDPAADPLFGTCAPRLKGSIKKPRSRDWAWIKDT